MSNAKIAQLGSPAEIYENPRTAFVAKFIGESNFFSGIATRNTGDGWEAETKTGKGFRIPANPAVKQGGEVQIAVRPEWMDLVRPNEIPANENSANGKVREVFYLGEMMHIVITLDEGSDVTVAMRNEGQLIKPLSWKVGDPAAVAWLPEDCQILESE
jgi:spermidine/putrescine transport system ATP-binding protein